MTKEMRFEIVIITLLGNVIASSGKWNNTERQRTKMIWNSAPPSNKRAIEMETMKMILEYDFIYWVAVLIVLCT